MSRNKDPLTPEERAVANALAGAAPRRGPSPQMDAAILASARAAAAADSAPPARRTHRRWPATLGVAASLVVAVGIAWQLRPVPEQILPAASEDALRSSPAPVSADQAPTATRRDAAPEAAVSPQTTAPSTPARRAGETGSAPAPMSEPAAPFREPELPAPTPPAPEVQAMDAEPAAGVTESAQTSPPPVAETAIGRGRVRQQAETPPVLTRTLGTSPAVTAPPGAALPETASDDGGIVFDRQTLHDVPPATVDSPGIHRAWLERIRELREAGDFEAARESLREYRRRYPDQPLPADLDGLLDE